MLEQIVQLDTQLFIYLNSMGTPRWDGFWLAYTSKLNWIPFYALLLYLIFRQLPLKSFLITLVAVALMIAVTDQVANVFKYGFMRLRPCHLAELMDQMRLVKAGCGGQYGFFSAHASNTMSIAVLVGLTLKKRFVYLIYVLIFWSVLMGYSRIYIGVHYPLDVLVGFLLGAGVGYLFFLLNRYVGNKLEAR